MIHKIGDYSNNDESNNTVIITLLGLIIFISFIAEETYTNTFKVLLFFFGVLLVQKLWKKVDKRIEQDGLKVTLWWVVGNVWRTGIVILSIIALFMFLGWYMGNPILVKIGGAISGSLLILMGAFLALGFLYAIVSIFIDHIRKKDRKG
ncbi:hypothetical protein HYS91_05185 [Candidatus Daviesbacteria bacterium]|nr:hypothetical protein [Candidatus Daviesbacteria bacterium]